MPNYAHPTLLRTASTLRAMRGLVSRARGAVHRPAPPSRGRPLGALERAFALDLDEVATFPALGIFELDARLDHARLERAFRQACREHALLHHAVRGGRWEPTDDVDARIMLHLAVDPWRHAHALFDRELHGPAVDLRRAPAVRIHHVVGAPSGPEAGSCLVVHVHHAVSDGRGFFALLCDLLDRYAEPAEVPARAPALPAAIDDCVGPPPGRVRTLARLAVDIATARGVPLLRSLPGRSPVGHRERRTAFVHHTLGGEVVRRLRARARAEGSSIHGVLSAALMIATAELGRTAGVAPGAVLRHGQNLDLRPHAPGAATAEVLCAIAVAALDVPIGDARADAMWSLARRVRTELTEVVASGRVTREAAALRWLPITRGVVRRFADSAAQGRGHTTFVSNVGVVPSGKNPRAPRIERVVLGSGQHVLGSLTWLGACTTARDLQLTFATTTPLVTTGELDALAERVCVLLREAAGTVSAAPATATSSA